MVGVTRMYQNELKRIPYEDIQERADNIADAICGHPEFCHEKFKKMMRELMSFDCDKLTDWPWVDRIRLVREVTSRVQVQK
jgi:hypothetical protein